MLFPTMPPQAARLLSALDALADVDAEALTPAEQAALLRVVGRVEAKVCAIKMGLLSAAERSGTARASGAADTGQWVAKVTNSDQAAAHRQAGLAAGLAKRRATARALAEGSLSA